MTEPTTVEGEVRFFALEDRVWDLLTDFEDFARYLIPGGSQGGADPEILVEVKERLDEGRPTHISIGVADPASGVSMTREVRCTYGASDVVWEILDPNGKGQVTSRFVVMADGPATTVRNEVSMEVDPPIPDYMMRQGAEQLRDRNLAWLTDRLA